MNQIVGELCNDLTTRQNVIFEENTKIILNFVAIFFRENKDVGLEESHFDSLFSAIEHDKKAYAHFYALHECHVNKTIKLLQDDDVFFDIIKIVERLKKHNFKFSNIFNYNIYINKYY